MGEEGSTTLAAFTGDKMVNHWFNNFNIKDNRTATTFIPLIKAHDTTCRRLQRCIVLSALWPTRYSRVQNTVLRLTIDKIIVRLVGTAWYLRRWIIWRLSGDYRRVLLLRWQLVLPRPRRLLSFFVSINLWVFIYGESNLSPICYLFFRVGLVGAEFMILLKPEISWHWWLDNLRLETFCKPSI